MTNEEALKLSDGLYRLYWTTPSPSSLASVGTTADGKRWFMPTNWVSGPSTDWIDVARAVPIELIAEVPVERAMPTRGDERNFQRALEAAQYIAKRCDSAFYTPPEGHGRLLDAICQRLDILVDALKIERKPQIEAIGNPDRPVGSDFAIPDDLKNTFAFVAGKSDGDLFVLMARRSRLQMYLEAQDAAVYYMPQPIPVGPGQLVRFQFAEER